MAICWTSSSPMTLIKMIPSLYWSPNILCQRRSSSPTWSSSIKLPSRPNNQWLNKTMMPMVVKLMHLHQAHFRKHNQKTQMKSRSTYLNTKTSIWLIVSVKLVMKRCLCQLLLLPLQKTNKAKQIQTKMKMMKSSLRTKKRRERRKSQKMIKVIKKGLKSQKRLFLEKTSS